MALASLEGESWWDLLSFWVTQLGPGGQGVCPLWGVCVKCSFFPLSSLPSEEVQVTSTVGWEADRPARIPLKMALSSQGLA